MMFFESDNWRDKDCLILGGGESLNDFVIPDHPRIIAVNRAIEFNKAQIFFSIDTRFYTWMKNGALGKEIQKIWQEFTGKKFFLLANYPINNYDFGNDKIIRINDKGIVGISHNYKDGLYHGCNSGFGALNLAIALGCNPIYLAGFDMQGANYKEYNIKTTEKQYDVFYAAFASLKYYLDKLRSDIKIYVTTPNSKLEKLFPYKNPFIDELKIELKEKNKYLKQREKGYRPSQCAPVVAEFMNQKLKDNKQFKILDIGCGDGLTVNILREKGFNCMGLDIAFMNLDNLDKETFIEASAWNMPFLDNEFDFTFSTDVLEHIPLQLIDKVIQEIFRITKLETWHCIANFRDERDGIVLHQIIKSMDWWRLKFDKLNNQNLKYTIIDRKDFLQLKPQFSQEPMKPIKKLILPEEFQKDARIKYLSDGTILVRKKCPGLLEWLRENAVNIDRNNRWKVK